MEYEYKKRVTKNDKKNKKPVFSQKHIRIKEDKKMRTSKNSKNGPVQSSSVSLHTNGCV